MSWLNIILIIAPAAILFALGYLIRYRKVYWLISGYNTMSAEKKSHVDTAALGVLMGNFCFAMGTLMLAGTLLLVLGQTVPGLVVLGLIIPLIIWLLITAQKYDGNTRNASGGMKAGAKVAIGLIVAGLIVLTGLVGYLMFSGSKPVAAAVEGGDLVISGIYGRKVPLGGITDAMLVDDLPAILLRTNGSAIGGSLRGHFLLEGTGSALLFLDRGNPPFIMIRTAETTFYLNQPTPDETRLLFEAIQAGRKAALPG